MRSLLLLLFCASLLATTASADRASFVDLAKRGWNYELRTTMVGRDMSIPIHINGRDLAGASLCLVGEEPHPASLEIINSFRDLAHHVFGKPLPMRYAGRSATKCGAGRTVVLRLYSGYPPNADLSNDLGWLNQVHQLGLPEGRRFAVSSPAMAQTFFGRRGQGTHIMVKQPALEQVGTLETLFYRSILIEELFQSFTFGMDILLFDRAAEFQSKLQELPINVNRMNWESRAFMRNLLNSNPPGLCMFDVFMFHAVAQAPVDQTVDPAFIDFIDLQYDRLFSEAQQTMKDPRFASIIAPGCRRPEI
ncbi:hypothetical protein PVW48_11645 [Dinoroseobacter sp. PD6]|uniref:hypothetical protein n=1 Tax=Dinoroseobacter sp. PD6 TaxID=3028384 RepID=UPI00237A81DD|nr:hypothetical protein [Dinoroseobacter sp. PD6]MDD9717403.1 hypothetical protein [Dinoroseobacter sp. PD6]